MVKPVALHDDICAGDYPEPADALAAAGVVLSESFAAVVAAQRRQATELAELRAELEALRTAKPVASWLDTEDACAHLGSISRTTLWDLATRGEIVREHIGRKPIYQQASLDAYVLRQRERRVRTAA